MKFNINLSNLFNLSNLSNCDKNERLELPMDIVIHVFILFTFLSIFFIFYTSKQSKKAIEDELQHNVSSYLSKTFENLSTDDITNLKDIFKILPLENLKIIYNNPDYTTTLNNKLFNFFIFLYNIYYK
jgi:hypothetical protein